MQIEQDPLDPMAVPIWEAFSKGLHYTINSTVSIKPGSPCSICRQLEQQGVTSRVRNHFHGSDLGACKRKVYWTMTAGKHVHSSSMGQSFLNDGHMHEALVLSTIAIGFGDKAKIHRYSNEDECIVEYGAHDHVKIIGHPDGVIEYNDMSAIIECKAVKDATWDEVRKGEISEEWYGQAQYYMLGRKFKRAYFIVKNRISSAILKPIAISLDPEWLKVNLKALQDIMVIFKDSNTHRIPDRAHKTPNKKECRWCPFKDKCWKPEEQMFINIDQPMDNLETSTGLVNIPNYE